MRHAVVQGRVAHSYLLCGPRGTGKTTTARLLAKATNCLQLQDGDPCGSCNHCLAISEGRFLDVIELDAASNRGIDEIRNIRDRVNFAPVEGHRKVYIIDEAHMLTEAASNAFLKTLEEPPDHVIFVLCTTEPQKLLPTIISRCQRFDFRRLPPTAIVDQLRKVSQEEDVAITDEALQALARYSGGSLRDAENLMEQLVVSYGSPVGLEAVQELLGLARIDRALELVQYLLMGNSASALGSINRAAWDGVDIRHLHRQALELIRAVLVHQWGAGDSLDLPTEVATEVASLASRAGADKVARALRLFAQVDLRRDSPSSLPLELAVVETCQNILVGEGEQATVPEARPSPSQASPPAADRETRRSSQPVATPAKQYPRRDSGPPVPPARELPSKPPSPQAQSGGPSLEGWSELVRTLSRAKGKRFNIGALLRDCKSQQVDGDSLVLTFAHRSHLERMEEEMEDPQSRRAIHEALEKTLGNAYTLSLNLGEDNNSKGAPSPADSPLVRFAMGMGARIAEDQEQ